MAQAGAHCHPGAGGSFSGPLPARGSDVLTKSLERNSFQVRKKTPKMVHRHIQGSWGLTQTEGEEPGPPPHPSIGEVAPKQPPDTVQGPPPGPWALLASSVPTPSRGSLPSPVTLGRPPRGGLLRTAAMQWGPQAPWLQTAPLPPAGQDPLKRTPALLPPVGAETPERGFQLLEASAAFRVCIESSKALAGPWGSGHPGSAESPPSRGTI